jgi:hypothetical protein
VVDVVGDELERNSIFVRTIITDFYKVSDISKYQEPYHFDVVADLLKSNMLLY